MSRRGLAFGLVALTAVLIAGLRIWTVRANEEQARSRAERLNRPPVNVEHTYTPASEEAATQPPAFVPARKLVPVLAGKVLRAADDSPLDGAVVEVLGAPGADGRPAVLCRTNTVPDGGFAITAPDLDATALRIWFPVDYEPAEPPPEGHPGFHVGDCVVQTVPLTSGDERRLDLTVRIDTGWILSGTVTDTTGKALTGGTVNIIEPREYSTIDGQGRYLIRDLPPDGKPLSVTASGTRVRSATLEAPPPPPGARAVQFDIQLAPAGMIYGQVTWRRGSSKPGNPPVITVLNPPEGAIPGSAETLAAVVDSEDNYLLDGLGPGSWDLSCAWTTIEGQQQRTFVTYARGVMVGPGEQVKYEFLLPGDATLQLKLTGADGAPLAGHRVEVSHVLDPGNPGSPVLREDFLTTSADGACTVTGLAPGTKELTVLGKPAPLEPGVAPAPVERLATQRVAVVDGTNSVTVVVGAH